MTKKKGRIIWKDIDGFEGFYQVSNTGEVRRLEHIRESNNQFGPCLQYYKEMPLKLIKHKQGYMKSTLTISKKPSTFLVHRLVAMAFIPNPDNLPEVNHINGIKDDNRVGNLEWCTSKSNAIHAREIGLILPQLGELNGMSKLMEHEVIEIYKLAKQKKNTQTEIGALFGVKKNAVSSIKLKTTWKELTDKYDKEKERS